MIIANPIYDSVFKFMLEDERVARILLSALLKREVVELHMRRNEFSKVDSHQISMFRIDFSAKVKDENGNESLVLIELQKTWLNTETLRFRQYLGTQYLDRTNVLTDPNKKGFGVPIISIYILGHKIGDIKEPIVYVRRQYLDYDNVEIVDGVPDPFIESLTHDSIIVQIPFLNKRAKNHLERILSFFDQDYRTANNTHYLDIDERGMSSDEKLVLNRLLLAVVTDDVRKSMMIEDDMLSEIEDRDTMLMMKNEEIKQKDKDLQQKDKDLQQKDKDLQQKDKDLQQKDDIIQQTVKNLSANGMNAVQISSIMSISIEDVNSILDEDSSV